MTRLSVVLDTNIYRGTGESDWLALRVGEERHSVIGHACYAVAIELLAQLATPETVDGRSAMASLKRLYDHCVEFDGSTYGVRFVTHAHEQVSHILFGTVPRSDSQAQYYAQLVGRLASGKVAPISLEPELCAIRDGAVGARSTYVQALWKDVVVALAPTARGWSDVVGTPMGRDVLAFSGTEEGLRLLATSLAREVAAYSGIALDAELEAVAASRVLDSYPLLVHYRNNTIRRIVEHGPDMTRRDRANGVLDLHVCCATSRTASLRGEPVVLVTNDTEILCAASDAAMKHRVLNPDEYRRLLACERDAFDASIQRMLVAA